MDTHSTRFSYDFNSPSIACFDPTKNESILIKKVIRYHYTSPGALKSILAPSGKDHPCFRFSDIHFMNDKSEMIVCVKRIIEYVLSHKDELPFCMEIVNDLLLKRHTADDYLTYSVNHVEYEEAPSIPFLSSRHFVLCLSESKDSLHMWNYYIHNNEYLGYNIGLNIGKFLKSYDTDTPHKMDALLIRYGKVLYMPKEQEKEFIPLLREIEEIPKRELSFEDKKSYGMILLRSFIEKCGVFFKDSSFSDEREYRIVIEITNDRITRLHDHHFNNNIGNIALEFYERKGILVPCLVVPFEKEAVSSITIAPIMDQNLAKEGLSEFLSVNNYQCDIHASTIPIRF